jgi:anti-sigma factor RsiW
MTDYADGELDQELHKEVADHLETCAGCRGLKEALLKKAIEPLKSALKVKPPEFIWQNIRERIISEEEPAAQSALSVLRERLSRVFAVPKPVFATVAVILIVFGLAVGGLSIYRQFANGYSAAESEFFSTEFGEYNGNASIIPADLGTSVEVFLM